MKERLDLPSLTMVLCAVAVTFIVIRREVRDGPGTDERARPVRVRDWNEYATGATMMGAPSGSITITEFSDFQCPYCRRFARVLADIKAKYLSEVKIAYRHFPLDKIHPHARLAAHASECAAGAGRFEAFHDALFAQQDSIGKRSWSSFAAESGVADTVSFQECMNDPDIAVRVKADETAGERLGVLGTPTVLINQWRLPGTPSFALVDSVVASLLPRR